MKRDPNLVPLSHDHQRALGLCVLVTRSIGKDANPANVASEAVRILHTFAEEIRPHFELEDAVLFPAAEKSLQMVALVAELREEHREILRLVSQLRGDPCAALVEAFCQTLERHIQKEERVLFEQMQQELPQDVLNQIGKALQAAQVEEAFPAANGCDTLSA